MGIFKRRRRSGPVDARAAIDAFWTWWSSEGAARTAAAIGSGTPESIATELADAVDAIHPGLEWELGPGTAAAHMLVVTAAGDPELRATARRWRRSGPPADPSWEYADTRQPDLESLDAVLTFDDTTLGFAEVVVATVPHPNRGSVDLVVHHPTFADIEPEHALRIAFLVLDNVIGEEIVEVWVGAIETAVAAPAGAIPLAELPGALDDFRRELSTADGEQQWVLMESDHDGRHPTLAAVAIPLRSMIAPHLDTHAGVELRYRGSHPNGLPDDDALGKLRSMEDHLGEVLGDSGRLVAHETSNGTRTLHWYLDGSVPADEQLRAAVSGWAEGRVRVSVDLDPGWDRVAHLRP